VHQQEICQTKAHFKAMPSDIHKSPSELTTITETNKNTPLDKICSQHLQALQQAGLITQKIPTQIKQLHCDKANAL